MSWLVLIRPNTSTVLLTCSGCTITRRPLESVNAVGWIADVGTSRLPRALWAQSGSVTGPLGLPPKLSAPPKPWLEVGLPDDWGVRMAVMAWEGSNTCAASASTCAGVTASIAAFTSSGELAPSNASACDQALARPLTEFFWYSRSAMARALAASTRSAGTPFAATSAA